MYVYVGLELCLAFFRLRGGSMIDLVYTEIVYSITLEAS